MLFIINSELISATLSELGKASTIDLFMNEDVMRIARIEFDSSPIVKRDMHPINKQIRHELMDEYKCCINCGNHKNLIIDHKNDMYNDSKVLSIDTQNKDDFQVLCNKCKDLKSNIAHRSEKKKW